MKLQYLLDRLLPLREAQAHCDIPCGIYDPVGAKIAAQTVQKMVLRIQAMDTPSPDAGADERTAYSNSMSRYVAVKEQHAELTKHEIDLLWHDYFKPEHLEKYPDLHTKVWEATKLASTNKQGVDMDAAQRLVASVDEIATIFWATKGVDYKDPNADVRFGT